MISRSIQEFLRTANVAYSIFPHRAAFTAQEEAAVIHIPGRDWAKSVICFADDEPVQAVVPADRTVDLERLLFLTGARTIRLAREGELDWLFPDCERGAMPPFGPLFRQRVFVDETLADEDQIVFNGGTHRDAVCMRFDDFAMITNPVVARFSDLPS